MLDAVPATRKLTRVQASYDGRGGLLLHCMGHLAATLPQLSAGRVRAAVAEFLDDARSGQETGRGGQWASEEEALRQGRDTRAGGIGIVYVHMRYAAVGERRGRGRGSGRGGRRHGKAWEGLAR